MHTTSYQDTSHVEVLADENLVHRRDKFIGGLMILLSKFNVSPQLDISVGTE